MCSRFGWSPALAGEWRCLDILAGEVLGKAPLYSISMHHILWTLIDWSTIRRTSQYSSGSTRVVQELFRIIPDTPLMDVHRTFEVNKLLDLFLSESFNTCKWFGCQHLRRALKLIVRRRFESFQIGSVAGTSGTFGSTWHCACSKSPGFQTIFSSSN